MAIINKRDQIHARAIDAEQSMVGARKVTSELVLVEVLNYFSGYRTELKEYVAGSVQRFLADEQFDIAACSSEQFRSGLLLYSARLDKGYSLTDCVSMNIMRENGISDILTNNDHFAQEGFLILL